MTTIQKKAHNSTFKDVLEVQMDAINFSNKEYDAWFKLDDELYIQITDGELTVSNSNGDSLFELSNERIEYWWSIADELFESKYEEELQEDSYWSMVDDRAEYGYYSNR